MKYVFIKEVTVVENLKLFSAFTALSDALKSEGLFDYYKLFWKTLHDQELENAPAIGFKMGNIEIRKLKLNKSNYNKKSL